MHRWATIVLVAVGACLGLAACGSDDKSSSSSEDAKLTRTELAAKADAICKAGATKVAAVKAPKTFEDANDAAAYFEQVVPLIRTETDDLAALVPDDAAKTDWDAFVAAQNAVQELYDTILAKAKAKDRSGEQDLQQIAPKSQAYAAAAAKIGSKQCAGIG